MPGPDTRAPFAALGGVVPADFAVLPTPCYLLDEGALARNAWILGDLAERTGCKVLLAQKAFSNYDLYPVLASHLAGTEASGLFEAHLGAEEMPGKEVHVFCAAYRDDEMEELLRWADHIVFNSPAQLAPSMTPAPPAAGWVPPAPSGTPPWRKIPPCPAFWTGCTSTPCANRIPTPWP